MTIHDKENFDSYEIKLEENLKELKSCQEDKEYISCMSCGSFFNCTLRKEYVKSVYDSMNKGKDGGFEF